MKRIYNVLIFVFVINFCSCNFTSTYHNRPSDKSEAEIVSNQLYDYLAKDQYSDAQFLFSEKFFEITSKDSLRKMFLDIKKLGKYHERSLVNWETLVMQDSSSKSEYVLFYDVVYEYFPAQEMIRLEKENDSIKIVAYQVKSDGFE